jgi:signal transduction histidine kinase
MAALERTTWLTQHTGGLEAHMPDVPLRAPHTRAATPRQSLSRRLAWLSVAVVLVSEAMVFLPSMARARAHWLEARVTEAEIAALSAAVAPDGVIDRATRDTLLRLTGAEAIRLDEPGRSLQVLAPNVALPSAVLVDMRQETFFEGLGRAVADVFRNGDPIVTIEARSPLREGATVTTTLHQRALHMALLSHARRFGAISLLVAAASGALLYMALLQVLVLPMRRLTESIAAFRADPEHARPLDPAMLAFRPGDEIAAAAQELAAMQHELRAALWRNARLAALGTALAKISHDLRGILSPALLTAERLQMNADPSVKRAGDVLVRTVERATELVRRTVEFARETPLALPKSPLSLRGATEEAAEQARAACPGLAVENAVPDDITVEADRESIVRVLSNLLRNAGEAGARRVRVTAVFEPNELAVSVADDGPGLPDTVQAALFRPFVNGGRRGSTGLGLAIVRDLVRAHGGDVALVETGPAGTCFVVSLPARRQAARRAAPPATASAAG